jgi:hypothetical protein
VGEEEEEKEEGDMLLNREGGGGGYVIEEISLQLHERQPAHSQLFAMHSRCEVGMKEEEA